MKPPARPSWLMVTALLLVTAAAASGAIWVFAWNRILTPPLPPILADLGGGTWEALSGRFTARLQRQYPPATPEGALIADLRAGDFNLSWEPSTEVRRAVRTWTSYPCAMSAEVFWQIDSKRQITTIRGEYHEAGCV